DVRVDAIEPENRVRPFNDRPAETLRVSEFECAALERDVAGAERHRPDQYEAANPDDHPDDEPRESRRHRRRIADEELVMTCSVLRTGTLPHVRPSGRGPQRGSRAGGPGRSAQEPVPRACRADAAADGRGR